MLWTGHSVNEAARLRFRGLRTLRKVVHEPLFWGATPSPSPLEELDMVFKRNNEWLRVSFERQELFDRWE